VLDLIRHTVVRPIEFDNQSSRFTEKIDNVWAARRLPAKFQSVEPTVT